MFVSLLKHGLNINMMFVSLLWLATRSSDVIKRGARGWRCFAQFPHQVTSVDIEVLWAAFASFTQHFIIGAIYHPLRPPGIVKPTSCLKLNTLLLIHVLPKFLETLLFYWVVILISCLIVAFSSLVFNLLIIGPTHAGHFLDSIYYFTALKIWTRPMVAMLWVHMKPNIKLLSPACSVALAHNKIKTQVQYCSHSPNKNALTALVSYLKEHINWDEPPIHWKVLIILCTVQDLLDMFFPLGTKHHNS